MRLQCYCCGEEVDGVIALITMSDSSVDRVFVMKPEHTERVDKVNVLLVERYCEFREDGCVCADEDIEVCPVHCQ